MSEQPSIICRVEIDPAAIEDGRVIDLGDGNFAIPGRPAGELEGEYEFPAGWQQIGATEDSVPLGLRPRGHAK